jgi:transmembrane sensor
MENNPSEITINQAAKWYARLHAPDCSQAEHNDFQRWLEVDPRHGEAYESVRSAAEMLSAKWSSDPRMAALASAALQSDVDNVARGRFRALKNIRGLAAGIFCLGIGWLAVSHNDHRAAEQEQKQVYANYENTRQRVDLADGSVVYLDVGAKINVAMSTGERRLELSSGRALFDVAHDKTRPFSVSAAGSVVVALGTRFQVELKPRARSVSVVLAEGSVAVSNKVGATAWREILTPGQKLQVDTELNNPSKSDVNAESLTSWSKGVLIFDGMPLANVLEEINRYAQIRVVLGDNTLANVPIAGNFIAGGDSSEFVETLTTILPLRSVRTGVNEIVLFQTHTSPSP